MWNYLYDRILGVVNFRRVYLAALLLVTALGAIAQPYGDPKFKKKFSDADGMAFDGNYADALILFKDLYAHDQSNANINHGIGLCELGLGNYQKAVDHLEAATRNVALDYQEANWKEKRAPGKTYYYLAKAYHNLGQFDQAVANYYNYRSFIDMDDYEVYNDVKRQIEYAENAKILLENPVTVDITNLGPGINTKYMDYCPVISADGQTLIFTSRRETGTGGELTDDGQYYDDIFVCRKQGQGWSKPESIGSNINGTGHEAAIGLSPDGQTLFIYKNDDIYTSELQGNQWSAPKEMGSDINTNAWETHATISADGNLLVFTSNRDGGYGGRDLYYSKKLPNGEWSMAQNMGDSVNTAYEEDSPFLTVDGQSLIFSSEGHTSMGGFDLFRSEFIFGKWSSPVNIGYPINSPGNDVFFVTTPDGRYAYYSSVREGGYGETDIYKLRLEIAKPAYATVLSGKVVVPTMSASNDLEAKITVKEVATGSQVGEYRPNRATGNYILILDPGIDYNVTYAAEGYQSKDVLVDVPENSSYYEIAKTVELTDVVFGEDILAQQKRKAEEEAKRLEAMRQKAIQDSLNAIAAADAGQLALANAKEEEARLIREQEAAAAKAAADEEERKRKEAEALLANAQNQNNEAAEQAKREQAEIERKKREAKAKYEAEQKAEAERLAAEKAEEEAEKEAQRLAILRAQQEADAAAEQDRQRAADAEAERVAEESKQAKEAEAQIAEAQEQPEVEDPVDKKRRELLEKIAALKKKKQGIGYDSPSEPVAEQSKQVEQPKVEEKPEPEPIAVATPVKSGANQDRSEIEKRLEQIRIDQEQLQTQALSEETEAERLKREAEAAAERVEKARKARQAELAAKKKQEQDLMAQIKKIEQEEKKRAEEAKLAAEKAKKEKEQREAAQALEEQRAREEADRLAELAKQQKVAEEASQKKQAALAEAAKDAQAQNSRNNAASDISELKRMNRELIEENRKLRDQFAEINRKLDIIISNMGVDGVARNVPEPKETLFSAEELKSGTNFVLKNIFFDYNQATLKPSSKKELNKLYYFLQENGDISIAVEGHTDSKGDDAYNMRLSQIRAESVKKYLTSMGIASSRLYPIGYGEKRPIAINENADGSDNPEGRALNRRIEISIRKGSAEKMEVEEITIPKGLQIGSR